MNRRFVLSLPAPALLAAALLAPALLPPRPAHAFCGFYVAKADARLFNEASRVVLVRDGDRTVITMANDYKGEPKDFAIVIPVPEVPRREQIHVTDMALIDHLDAYSAPRLVEYFDDDPCVILARELPMAARADGRLEKESLDEALALGVTIEATYTVGEYDILILSAEESQGLVTWLTGTGYRLPPGAERVLGSYLKQSMRFFVAKVNLDAHAELGYRMLRPLQVAYESPKFMLPIRLGTVNADGAQELYVFALTRTGRVETTNYRTVKLPSDVEIPVFVKDAFGDFYRAMFDRAVERERMRAVFLEYAWDMAWCDPCAADPLSADELRELGVFWLGDGGRVAPDVYVTRLHVRYDGERFPDDLFFQETGNRENFQGRYIVRHAWSGATDCEPARAYRRALRERHAREAETLASLTGWDLVTIREKMAVVTTADAPGDPWWRRLWDQ